MARTTTKLNIKPSPLYPLMSGQERREIWEKAWAAWKPRDPKALDRELKKLRKEWDRKII
jgi:hypothetical protein